MLIDLHAKTSRSKGVTISAEDVAQKAKSAGLDAVAFCETLSSAHCADALLACEKAGIQGFVGVEIPTAQGIVLGFVPEVGPFIISEEWRQLTELVTPTVEQVVELFKQHDGVVIAAKPYDLNIPHAMGDHIFDLQGLRAVQVFASGLKSLQSDFALEAAAFLNLPTVGGSGGSQVGDYATLFSEDIASQAEFVAALKDGDYWAVHIGAPEARREFKREERSERPDRGNSRGGKPRSGGGDRGGRGRNDRGGKPESNGDSRKSDDSGNRRRRR